MTITFKGKIDLNCRCPSQMLVLDQSQVQSPAGLNCAVCLTPKVPPPSCCHSCFSINWPGMTIAGCDTLTLPSILTGDPVLLDFHDFALLELAGDMLATSTGTPTGAASNTSEFGGPTTVSLGSGFFVGGCAALATNFGFDAGAGDDYRDFVTTWAAGWTGYCCSNFRSRIPFGGTDAAAADPGGSSLLTASIARKSQDPANGALLTIYGYFTWGQTGFPSFGNPSGIVVGAVCNFLAAYTSTDMTCSGGNFTRGGTWLSYGRQTGVGTFGGDGTGCPYCPSILDTLPTSLTAVPATCAPAGTPPTFL